MNGLGIGALRVIATDRYSRRTMWSKEFHQGSPWMRAEVQLANLSSSFQVSEQILPFFLFHGIIARQGSLFLEFKERCHEDTYFRASIHLLIHILRLRKITVQSRSLKRKRLGRCIFLWSPWKKTQEMVYLLFSRCNRPYS